jgi:hypothetical protein
MKAFLSRARIAELQAKVRTDLRSGARDYKTRAHTAYDAKSPNPVQVILNYDQALHRGLVKSDLAKQEREKQEAWIADVTTRA